MRSFIKPNLRRNGALKIQHTYFLFLHFFILIFRLAFEKVSILNSFTFTNFDHKYWALNLLYHEMSLLFHQRMIFSFLMLVSVKKNNNFCVFRVTLKKINKQYRIRRK